jgi:hypothetical protein
VGQRCCGLLRFARSHADDVTSFSGKEMQTQVRSWGCKAIMCVIARMGMPIADGNAQLFVLG